MKPNIVRTTLKITAGLASQFPKDNRPQVALSGRSNVGKSSLINTVIGRKNYARVSCPATALPSAQRAKSASGRL